MPAPPIHVHHVQLAQGPPIQARVHQVFEPSMEACYFEPMPDEAEYIEGSLPLWGYAAILDTRSGAEPSGYNGSSRWALGVQQPDPNSGHMYWHFIWEDLYFPARGKFVIAIQISKVRGLSTLAYRTGRAITHWVHVTD